MNQIYCSDRRSRFLTFLILPLILCGLLPARTWAAAAVPPAKWWIQWTDYDNNPVALSQAGGSASAPYLLSHPPLSGAPRLQMWFDSDSGKSIVYTTSEDGTNWSPQVSIHGLQTLGESPQGQAVVLLNSSWAKPYRIYYASKSGTQWQIRVAEGLDGVQFENDQVAFEGGRLGETPLGHAVAEFPNRNGFPNDPHVPGPFLLYFRERNGMGIAYATSVDGYKFSDVVNPGDSKAGLIRIPGLPEGVVLNSHPSQVLRLAQNDYRMFVFDDTSFFRYLVSGNGLDWEVAEAPVETVGAIGEPGAWNDVQNFSASTAYLGEGRFILARTGLSTRSSKGPQIGLASGQSEFYQMNDFGRWSFFSPLTKYQSEGWSPFSSTGNSPDGVQVAAIQNDDGTVSIRQQNPSGDFFLTHETAWVVPFTLEFRARLDDASGTGADALFPKYTVGAFLNDPLEPGGKAWQPAFSMTRSGGWDLSKDPAIEVDNSDFQSYTIVARFDESARQALIKDPGDATANTNLCVYEIYTNRNFSAPSLVFHNTGFLGWDSVDLDGRLDIGFPSLNSGQVTVDWVRWGNGVIFDPVEPPGVESSQRPRLSISQATDTTVTVSWTGSGGTLESKETFGSTWIPVGVANPSVLPIVGKTLYFRVVR